MNDKLQCDFASNFARIALMFAIMLDLQTSNKNKRIRELFYQV